MIGHQVWYRSPGLFRFIGTVVGEHSSSGEALGTTLGGAAGKANVGISNEKAGENPAHR